MLQIFFIGTDHTQEISRIGCFYREFFASMGMYKSQRLSMQELTRDTEITTYIRVDTPIPIRLVPEHRVTDVGHMDADLVRTPRLDTTLEESI